MKNWSLKIKTENWRFKMNAENAIENEINI